jgi:acylphosphatase
VSAVGGRVRVHVVVTGRVQGVWFRESCRREADRLGVAGWVRNRADGEVEIEAEGPAGAVAALVDWARRGPDRAVVTGVSVDDVPPRGETAFSVSR